MTPSRETIAKRIARGWTPERARATAPLAVGIKMKTELRPYLYPKAGRWFGNVRGPGDRRIYLGIYQTREQAQQAALDYIATGIKPPRSNARQPRKPRESHRTPPKAQKPAPAPAAPRDTAKEERLAMIRRIYQERLAA